PTRARPPRTGVGRPHGLRLLFPQRHPRPLQARRRPVHQATWTGSDDSEAIGSWSGAPIGWLKQLAKADKGKLTIEARGMQGRNSNYEFDIEGIREALGPISKECGWSL
ncbi:type VI secretion protein, partial [Reyranella soli]|uniref:type VI secretion protein n=1 Tax=Reyranella soli TaxID=1230389 RepID=UPI001C3FEA00